MATASPNAIQILSYFIVTITLEMGAVSPDSQMSKPRLKDVKKTLEKREDRAKRQSLAFFFILLCFGPFLLVTKQARLFSDLMVVRGESFPPQLLSAALG